MCFYWSTVGPTLLSALSTHLTYVLNNENENTELDLGHKNEFQFQ